MSIEPPLSPTILYILLALSQKDRHGYEIMKQVVTDSRGVVHMAAGTLYNALQRLVAAGLVMEADARPAPELDDERRHYYSLTESGRRVLTEEMDRLRGVVALGLARIENPAR